MGNSTTAVILGIPCEGGTADAEELVQQTRDNLYIAFEPARRYLTERAAKQAAGNDNLPPYSVVHPDQQVLVYRPYQDADGPNPKLLLPWRRPYAICSQLSPVVYRVRRMKEKHKYPYTSPTLNPTIRGKHSQRLNLTSWRGFSWEDKFPYPRWTIQMKVNQQLSHMSLTEWSVTNLDRAKKVCITLNTACV